MPALIQLRARRLVRLLPLLGVLAASLAGGCAAVQPWQRGHLADYTMKPDRDPLGDLFAEHVYFTREGASGGRGVGGGGCGCN